MWQTFLYQPIYNIFILIYNIFPLKDVGWTIIILTLLIRLILFPLSWSSVRSQRLMQSLAPELEKIKEKYKNDQQKLTAATMNFYKEHGINPLSSCLPLLVQLPILIALYQVLSAGLNHDQFDLLYSFVPKPAEALNNNFLGFIDLTKPYYPLAIIAGISQLVQGLVLKPATPQKKKENTSKGIINTEDISQAMNLQFTYIMPIMTVFISWKLFAGLPLYWITTTLFTVVSQILTIKFYPIKNIQDADSAFHEHQTPQFSLEPEVLETKTTKNITVSVKKRITPPH